MRPANNDLCARDTDNRRAATGRADPASFHIRGDHTTTVLEISGELDLANQDQLADNLRVATLGRCVIVDARRVTFIDLAALRALTAARRYVEADDGGFCLVTAGHRIPRLLALTHVTFMTATSVFEARVLLDASPRFAIPASAGRDGEPSHTRRTNAPRARTCGRPTVPGRAEPVQRELLMQAPRRDRCGR